MPPPLFRPLNHHKTAISKTTKTKLKTQKNRLFRRFFCKIWSECGDSNPGPPAPKPMSEPSARPLAPPLVLSGTPTVSLWNSFGLFASGTAFVFWDLCGIEFCILKVLPTGFDHSMGHSIAESDAENESHKQRI